MSKQILQLSRVEVAPGRFVLPLHADDQCGKHRTGPACGKCIHGYTLSYEFDFCADTEDCTLRITILVVVCTILLWVIVIVATISLMRMQITIGYFYGFINYYSVVDTLLRQLWNYSHSMHKYENILSSIVRLSPGFVGKLCFIKGMSGIDQYALYSIHPTAVLLILVMFAVFARHSIKFAVLIRKGIIRGICLILILTYTSIADTALQMLRYIKFTDIDATYCYLSPDIRYFTGRHIAYVIIALLYELMIIGGLPLILLMEPFINHKINFIRIKPLLDQFQDVTRTSIAGLLLFTCCFDK